MCLGGGGGGGGGGVGRVSLYRLVLFWVLACDKPVFSCRAGEDPENHAARKHRAAEGGEKLLKRLVFLCIGRQASKRLLQAAMLRRDFIWPRTFLQRGCQLPVVFPASFLVEAFRRKGKLYLVFEFVEKSMLDILEVGFGNVHAQWRSWFAFE